MNYYLLIALCVIVLISYIFDITSKYTRIPGVILLIVTGMIINYLLTYFNIHIPDISGLLPMMGTVGLVLIVLEGSLDLNLSRKKRKLITQSVSSAIMQFMVLVSILTYILVSFFDYSLKIALANIIPLGIISSAVAIPSASGLNKSDREFVTYESSFSDIIGILAFDFILYNQSRFGESIMDFTIEIILTLLASVVLSAGLAFILHRITHHVKYVIITTSIMLVFALAKLIHLPSLLVVLIFGLSMNNNHLFKNKYTQQVIDFEEFSSELKSFKHITGELTFIIRSFFFIIFGFYTYVSDLVNLNNLFFAIAVSVSIFVLRALYFKIVLKIPLYPLLFFAPRGLITILLFLTIPINWTLPFVNQGLITQVIFISILLMAFGNLLFRGKKEEVITVNAESLL
jgi:potassium/hydrogen antiporter